MLDLFNWFWRLQDKASQQLEGDISYKQKAFWVLIEGFAKSGMYLLT